MTRIKSLFKLGVKLSLFLIFTIVFSDFAVRKSTEDRIYQAVQDIPHHDVGMVLGTAKTLSNGYTNRYYTYRLEAAVRLYKAKKIDYILVSGDNGRKEYDEPSTFKKDLVAAGVPASRVYLDYAGFRTLDSVVRCKEVFGQSSVTIISQRFHNERALFLASCHELDAVAFDAKDVSKRYGLKVQAREYFARVKMMLDILTLKGPKFLGDPVIIG